MRSAHCRAAQSQVALPAPALVNTIEAFVWKTLRDDRARPSVLAVAGHCGLTALTLRRFLRRSGRPSCRELVTHARVTYAAKLLTEGTKVDAVILLAGFRNRTNFGRQFREFLGCTPGEYLNEARVLSQSHSTLQPSLGAESP
jgi:methylphosphotriester-DNA--protein-cysteine methyltransferase